MRFAVIGSGGMGHARATHLAQLPDCSIGYVSSRNSMTGPSLAARFGAAYVPSWEDAVTRDEVEAVIVATHNDTHAEIARAALDAGKHVLVEYPLATRLEDADALVDVARRRNLIVNGVLATPTRGGGRSIWRNRQLSGPPFMVGIAYVYHLLDLFGPVDWVEGTCAYDGLDEAGYYRSSTSTMTVCFRSGGVAQILYIRGFSVPRDEQTQAMMFSKGFLSYRGYVSGSQTNSGHLTEVTPSGQRRLDFPPVTLAQASRQNTERFVQRLRGDVDDDGRLMLAREAVAVALGAEQAADQSRRIYLGSLAAVAA